MFNLFKSRPKNLFNENGLNEILWKNKDSEGRHRIETLFLKKNGLLDGDFFYFQSPNDSPLSTRYGDEKNLNYYLSSNNHNNLVYAFFVDGVISGKSYRVLEGIKYLEETYVAGNLVKSIKKKRKLIIPNSTVYGFDDEVKTYQFIDKKEGELKKLIDDLLNKI